MLKTIINITLNVLLTIVLVSLLAVFLGFVISKNENRICQKNQENFKNLQGYYVSNETKEMCRYYGIELK